MGSVSCCSDDKTVVINTDEKEYEIVNIPKTKKVCPMCEDFAQNQINKNVPISIVSCEGACLRGEVSRQAANKICYSIKPEKTSRICLGGAFTKDGGQRELLKKSKKVVVLEGCYINCASRMLSGIIPNLAPQIIQVDRYYDFDKNLFAINDVTESEIKIFVDNAIKRVIDII